MLLRTSEIFSIIRWSFFSTYDRESLHAGIHFSFYLRSTQSARSVAEVFKRRKMNAGILLSGSAHRCQIPPGQANAPDCETKKGAKAEAAHQVERIIHKEINLKIGQQHLGIICPQAHSARSDGDIAETPLLVIVGSKEQPIPKLVKGGQAGKGGQR